MATPLTDADLHNPKFARCVQSAEILTKF